MKTIGIYAHAKGVAVAITEPDTAPIVRDYPIDPTTRYCGRILPIIQGLPEGGIQIASPNLASGPGCLYWGAVVGMLTASGRVPKVIPGPDMMAAIQLGPRGKSEMALRQVFKCWQVELNSTAEALSFAVAKAEATTKGDK